MTKYKNTSETLTKWLLLGVVLASVGLMTLIAKKLNPTKPTLQATSRKTSKLGNFQKTPLQLTPSVSIVEISPKGGWNCQGVLLTPRIAVTAAHCVDGYAPHQIFVIDQKNSISVKKIEYASNVRFKRLQKKMHTKKSFNNNDIKNNVAFVVLSKDSILTHFPRVNFKFSLPGVQFTVYRTSPSGKVFPLKIAIANRSKGLLVDQVQDIEHKSVNNISGSPIWDSTGQLIGIFSNSIRKNRGLNTLDGLRKNYYTLFKEHHWNAFITAQADPWLPDPVAQIKKVVSAGFTESK